MNKVDSGIQVALQRCLEGCFVSFGNISLKSNRLTIRSDEYISSGFLWRKKTLQRVWFVELAPVAWITISDDDGLEGGEIEEFVILSDGTWSIRFATPGQIAFSVLPNVEMRIGKHVGETEGVRVIVPSVTMDWC